MEAHVFHSNYAIDLTAQSHWAIPTAAVAGPLGIVSPHASDVETEASEEVTSTMRVSDWNINIFHQYANYMLIVLTYHLVNT
jgi:hypothetical protein